MSEEYNKDIQQLGEDYRATFSTPEGLRVFEDLKAAYYHRTSFASDPHQTAFHEGERSVIIRLINLMKETKE
tara:strand:+ start:3759 stop:3974 length:216 start_codon:yes stop_codon:yes gene_type:complete